MAKNSDEPCETCEHQWGPHVLIATMVTPEHGGLIFCNVPGCKCQTTWSIDDEPLPYIPDDETVEELRALAQTDEDADWEYEEGPDRHLD